MKKLALLPVAAIAAVAFASPANAADQMPSSERVSVNASQAAKQFDADVLGIKPSKPSKGKCATLTFALEGGKKGPKGKGKSKGKSAQLGHIVTEGPGLTPVPAPIIVEGTSLPTR